MFRIACLLAICLCLGLEASAGAKRAFIVGVGTYAELPALQKTTGDANGYADAFSNDLGFEVTRLIDPTRMKFLEAFNGFLSSIEPGDEVAFVFSGHGWSDGADNYLALTDAPLESSEFALRYETVSLSISVLAELKARKPALLFAIVDACRDNPFDTGTRSVTRGMVRQEIVPGTLVVYAAGARQKALDRLGPEDDSPYSVFTRALLPRLKDPTRPLLRSVDETRSEVAMLADTIHHEQRPAIYSDVSLDFCFAGECQLKQVLDQETQDWIYISSDGYTQLDTCEKYRMHLGKYPDGKFAAVAKQALANPPCASRRLKLKQAAWYADLAGHTDEIYGLDYSPSGRFLASASADGTARLWVVGMTPTLFGQSTVFEGHTEPLLSVRFSPNEEFIMTTSKDDTARIWRATGGQPVQTLRQAADVSFADFSPDGRRVATACYDGSVIVWDLASGEELLALPLQPDAVRSVRYSADGKRLLTASNDGRVGLWNAETGEQIRLIQSGGLAATYAEFDADEERILVASADGTARIWGEADEPLVLEGHDGPLWNAAFSPDGEMVVTTAEDRSARLWDARNGAELAKLQDLGAFGANWAVFAPDGTTIAAAMTGAKLQLWRLTFEDAPAP